MKDTDRRVPIRSPFITLADFLKWAGVTPSGGQAKLIIASGQVMVNGVTEPRRGRKLYPGDQVTVTGNPGGSASLRVVEEGN